MARIRMPGQTPFTPRAMSMAFSHGLGVDRSLSIEQLATLELSFKGSVSSVPTTSCVHLTLLLTEESDAL